MLRQDDVPVKHCVGSGYLKWYCRYVNFSRVNNKNQALTQKSFPLSFMKTSPRISLSLFSVPLLRPFTTPNRVQHPHLVPWAAGFSDGEHEEVAGLSPTYVNISHPLAYVLPLSADERDFLVDFYRARRKLSQFSHLAFSFILSFIVALGTQLTKSLRARQHKSTRAEQTFSRLSVFEYRRLLQKTGGSPPFYWFVRSSLWLWNSWCQWT